MKGFAGLHWLLCATALSLILLAEAMVSDLVSISPSVLREELRVLTTAVESHQRDVRVGNSSVLVLCLHGTDHDTLREVARAVSDSVDEGADIVFGREASETFSSRALYLLSVKPDSVVLVDKPDATNQEALGRLLMPAGAIVFTDGREHKVDNRKAIFVLISPHASLAVECSTRVEFPIGSHPIVSQSDSRNRSRKTLSLFDSLDQKLTKKVLHTVAALLLASLSALLLKISRLNAANAGLLRTFVTQGSS